MSDKKNIWRLIIQTLITILTSIGTTLTTQAACFCGCLQGFAWGWVFTQPHFVCLQHYKITDYKLQIACSPSFT